MFTAKNKESQHSHPLDKRDLLARLGQGLTTFCNMHFVLPPFSLIRSFSVTLQYPFDESGGQMETTKKKIVDVQSLYI